MSWAAEAEVPLEAEKDLGNRQPSSTSVFYTGQVFVDLGCLLIVCIRNSNNKTRSVLMKTRFFGKLGDGVVGEGPPQEL